MGTGKEQGTSVGSVDSLVVPMQMLALGKFREAELLTEQYLQKNNEDGMAYLVLYAAKVKCSNLHNFKKRDSVSREALENFYLYVEHRAIFENFLRYGENEDVERIMLYMKQLFKLIETNAYDVAMPEEGAGTADFFEMILNILYTSDRSAFRTYAFDLGVFLLKNFAFTEAKQFFENAKENGADKAECLLHILYATLEVRDEEEFEYCENFSVEMPEYLNLLLALGENKAMLEKVTALVEANEKGRVVAQERRKMAQAESKLEKYTKERTPLQVLGIVFFWIFSGLALLYFLFIHDEGAIWQIFVNLTPFGRADATGQIRVSLVTSTVIFCIAQVVMWVMISLPEGAEGLECKNVRKRVFWTFAHVLLSFGIWYVMYWYAHWFENWLGFFNVVVTLVLAFVAECAHLGLELGVGLGVGAVMEFFNTKMEGFFGRIWVRGYNREYLAILYLSFASFLVLNPSYDQIHFLSVLTFAFFVVLGLLLFFKGIKMRADALIKFSDTHGYSDAGEIDTCITTELVTGAVYIVLAPSLALAFAPWGYSWRMHIGLEALLLICGLIHIIIGLVARKKANS